MEPHDHCELPAALESDCEGAKAFNKRSKYSFPLARMRPFER